MRSGNFAEGEQPDTPPSASEAAIRDINSRRFTSSIAAVSSPVANRTIRQLEGRLNVVLLHELTSQSSLIRGWLPTHRENLLLGPQKVLRMPMALKTPGHMQIVRFPGQRHLVHTAVTGFTADAFRHMVAVIEIHEVGKTIDAVPSQRTDLA